MQSRFLAFVLGGFLSFLLFFMYEKILVQSIVEEEDSSNIILETHLYRKEELDSNTHASYMKCATTKIPKLPKIDNCEKDLADVSIYPLDLNLDTEEAIVNNNKRFDKRRNVTYLEDNNWGFTCNKIEILAGCIYSMRQNGNEIHTNMLALGPLFSSIAYHLDLIALSRDFPVLLECLECDGGQFVNCGAIVIKGEITIISPNGTYPISNMYKAGEMYWYKAPNNHGYMEEYSLYLIPHDFVRRSVEKIMLNRKSETLGVHRRNMENWCYRYIGGGWSEYECVVGSEAKKDIDKMVPLKTTKKFEEKFYFKPLEKDHPYIMTCNYTLDEEQLEIFKTAWPQVFKENEKMDVLFTTDSNDPAGDKIFKSSSIINTLFTLEEISPDHLCSRRSNRLWGGDDRPEHRILFGEMYALALSDYHMANPLSSCDITVVHWRKQLGKPIHSSFPTSCYDAFYRGYKRGNKVL